MHHIPRPQEEQQQSSNDVHSSVTHRLRDFGPFCERTAALLSN